MSSQEKSRDITFPMAPTDPASKVPFKLWEMILEDTPPSQLMILDQVSRPFARVVRGLSIWKVIWDENKDIRKTVNMQGRDFYEAYVTSSEHICDGCYRYRYDIYCFWYGIYKPFTWRREAREQAQELLKVSRFIDKRYLCNICEESRAEQRNQRRKYLECHLKDTLGGNNYDTTLLPIQNLPYILSGYQGDIQATVDFITREAVHIGLEKALPPKIRRSKLEFKLQERGLQLRTDSQLCNTYIFTGETKSVDKIVEVMAELDWLHRETRYGELRRGRTIATVNPLSVYRITALSIKKEALEEYIHNRLENNQWSQVQDDPNTPARPPKFLWDLIEKLTPTVCLKLVLHYVSFGPSASTDKIQMFTDEQLILAMDIGAEEARRVSMSASSTSLKLSQGLKQLLAESSFNSLLTRCKRQGKRRTRRLDYSSIYDP